jgi:hypothetical protein
VGDCIATAASDAYDLDDTGIVDLEVELDASRLGVI